MIYGVGAVKRAETRERKIVDLVAMLARHEAPHPRWHAPKRMSNRRAAARSEGRRTPARKRPLLPPITRYRAVMSVLVTGWGDVSGRGDTEGSMMP